MDITCVMSIYDEPIWMVERAIKSMEAQSYPLKQMIMIADKPDNTELIQFVKEYAEKSSLPIRVEVNPTNRGVAYSLNRGFGLAETDYICRMDADDESLPTRIEESMKLFETGADIVATAATVVDEEGNMAKKQRIFPCSAKAIEAISRYIACVFHPTWLLKKKVWEDIGGYREAMKAAQDYDFIIRALKQGFVVCSCTEPLLRYTERTGSISGAKTAMQAFLSIYAQNNVYRGEDFRHTIAQEISAGICKDYEVFKPFCTAFFSSHGLKRVFITARGVVKSRFFRIYILNAFYVKALKRYYLRKELLSKTVTA